MKARELGERRSAWAGLALALAALMAMWAAAAASAAPQVFWQSAVGNGNPGARGVAASPINPGHVFATDQTGARVVELSAWGELVKMWGWDVVASGPGDDTVAPEDQFEICVPADGDTCKAGVAGSGVGQISAAVGAAVDSAGDVYVFDAGALRVEKFSADGEFLLMFGGEVNKTTPANVCTKADVEGGETCGAGTSGTAPGQFGAVRLGDYIEIDSEDKVYVGDVGRIERFDSNGIYQDEVSVPGETLTAVSSDSDGDLYVAYQQGFFDSKANVHKLDPASGEELCRFEAKNPRAVSVAEDGDLYAFDKLGVGEAKIKRYGPACSGGSPPPATPPQESFGEGLNVESAGLATSSACGIEGVDVYHANVSPSFIRAYVLPEHAYPDPDICLQPPLAPQISAQYATTVGTDSASLEAQINPVFWTDATYYIEYGTDDCSVSTCKKLLFPGAPLTSEVLNEGVPADADIEGLAAGTTYHFRFVAQSGGGGPVVGSDSTFTTYRPSQVQTDCPNQALRTGASTAPPDCRAYEMVSPADKNGGEATASFLEGLDATETFAGHDQSTSGGERLAYTATTAFGDAVGSPAYHEYIASRGPSGWNSESIDPPVRGGSANGVGNITSQFKAFSKDLCQGWLVPEASQPLTLGPVFGYRNIYRSMDCATTTDYTWLQSSAEVPEPCANPECPRPYLFPDLQVMSGDGSCAVFRVNDALADAPHGFRAPGLDLTVSQLYLWCEDKPVRLVSKLPGSAPFEGTSSAGSENTSFAFRGDANAETVEHALSVEGTRVYWTASEAGVGASGSSKGAIGKLYLRVNADKTQSTGGCEPERACTLQVSPSGETSFPDKAQFWTANTDGTRAIFSIIAGPDARKLYEFTFDPTTGAKSSKVIAGKTLGVAGASEDATRLYFASEEVCSSEPNSVGDVAQPDEPNLYRYETGESCTAGQMDFVGTLAEEDIPPAVTIPSPVTPVPRDHVARASADGGQLLFTSAASLTGFDNADVASGKADREVYLYDVKAAGGPALRCVSCNPSGARPRGADVLDASRGTAGISSLWTAAYIPGYQHQLYGRRLITAGGNRVFFNSLDALSIRDTNGAQDVYQWEAPGTGSCTSASATYSAASEGCIDLISSGQSARDSEWVESSAGGEDVFIRTEESLVPKDPGSVDIYDARVNGGFAEPAPAPTCEGDSCQSVPSPPPADTPASEAFHGPGNQLPERGCGGPARRAAGLAHRARRLRHRAHRAARHGAPPARTRKLARRARRLAHRAKGLSARARRCRGSRGGTGR